MCRSGRDGTGDLRKTLGISIFNASRQRRQGRLYLIYEHIYNKENHSRINKHHDELASNHEQSPRSCVSLLHRAPGLYVNKKSYDFDDLTRTTGRHNSTNQIVIHRVRDAHLDHFPNFRLTLIDVGHSINVGRLLGISTY